MTLQKLLLIHDRIHTSTNSPLPNPKSFPPLSIFISNPNPNLPSSPIPYSASKSSPTGLDAVVGGGGGGGGEAQELEGRVWNGEKGMREEGDVYRWASVGGVGGWVFMCVRVCMCSSKGKEEAGSRSRFWMHGSRDGGWRRQMEDEVEVEVMG